MRKWFHGRALLLTCAMMVSLAGCTAGEENAANNPGDTHYRIGILQQLEHQALDAATEGFQAALTDLLGDRVEFDYQNAQNDSNNCITIANKFVSDKVDLIMANASTALQSAAAATSDIPIVGTSVTDYKTAGVVDSNDAPGRNVTGASDLAPIEAQIDLLTELCPEARTVGIVYCSSEPNSLFQAEMAQTALEAKGCSVKVYTVADSNEIQSVVTKAASEIDAMYIPTDNTLADNMGLVKNITTPQKLPVFCGEENMCRSGGLATLSISYYDVGYTAGEMAYEILTNGKNPADMPIEFVPDVVKKYNSEVASELGITLPDGFTAIEG